ncbi:hypothetical protein [Chryseobacterium polytrichastri]|uniref:Uncharacterized protein n=1 Tax=Chryseobacterium polytrichastri TaxID=1302687 RepID=A0A1M6TFF9_9FLAO|nr:hypothetical protein [Chryseobacterium polytrichastri]SHK55772.1 hypothetical protein SAMN05444267_100581 [Chryseobacterium polytrichastri]
MNEEQQSNPNEDAKKFFNENYQDFVNSVGVTEDSKSLVEEDFLFSGGLDNIDVWIKHEEFRLKKINSNSERQLREKNAKLAFEFARWWAIFIGVFILLHGFNGMDFCKSHLHFNISDTEFMFVCGTLTASILIFYLNVIRNLFPNKFDTLKNEDKSSE